MKQLTRLYNFIYNVIPTFFYCLVSGLHFDPTWSLRGKIHIVNSSYFLRKKNPHIIKGKVVIGKSFKCNSQLTSNSVGVFQPCLFNVSTSGSCIIIGNNVGISGSTINATTKITIGDNTIIGSGCLISDTDSHQISAHDRISGGGEISSSPIIIGCNVFIGARCIILKGVKIGDGAVIGAGSVVTKNIPSYVIAAGNPAKVIKRIVEKSMTN